MKRNLMDGVMDATLKMMKGYEAFLDKEFKNVKPFNKERMTKREQMDKYRQFTPETEQMMRQTMGNQVVDAYKSRMESMFMEGGNG